MPRKRQNQEVPQTLRKSRRLTAQSPEDTGRGLRQLSVTTGLSTLSTQPEPPETWESLKSAAKARVDNYTPADRAHDALLCSSLHAFLEWLPEGGRESVARDITNSITDDSLWRVFHNLLTGLLYPMQSTSRKPSVTSSPHQKRWANVQAVASTLDQPKVRDSQFRSLCLRRDGSRCLVTDDIDVNKWEELGRPDGVMKTVVEAAHIIPYFYASWDRAASPGDACEAWEVLFRCFPEVRHCGLSVDDINDLSNGMTLNDTVHSRFGSFRLAFVKTETANVYTVKVYPRFPDRELALLPADRLVEFKQAEGAEDLSLPGPVLLDCHYRVAEILNASGMSGYIERKLRDWEDLKEIADKGSLREDGATDITRILNTALWQRVEV